MGENLWSVGELDPEFELDFNIYIENIGASARCVTITAQYSQPCLKINQALSRLYKSN